MVGFGSRFPTLFVSESIGYDKTGKIGIGNITDTHSMEKLTVKADYGEVAAILVEPYSWGENFVTQQASIFLGASGYGITSDYYSGLIFNSGSNFIFNGKTSNVGIGTSSPLSKLEVIGQVSIGYRSSAPAGQNNLIVEGNVGIGTYNPLEKLDVDGKIKTTGFQLLNGQLNGQLNGNILQCDNEGNATWVDPSVINDGDWTLLTNNLFVESGRNVGIGTSTPTQPLDVVGNVKISGDIYGGHNDWQALKLYAGTNYSDGAYLSMNSNYAQTASIKLYARGENGRVEFHNHERQVMSVRGDGNVYVGDSYNTSNMVVNGEINALLVRATINLPWPDYVFDKDYNLMPLTELEQFVTKNHHLPDMPTEEEVHEEGVNLAEMNALLLKKVEELTLYVIELNKENEEIKREINELK